ncbi:MAG: type IVB secretion system apparatus protein IcmL/DotI, partial [Coxiellaceae bacterium]|nr:type IVB secretion system apparatus protein IcmL/DotI [Coxiellaceae bacterium]
MSKITDKYSPERNLLYRDHYRRTVKSIITMAIVGGILAVILAGLIIETPQPKYYATTTSGEVVPMHSLSEPVITNDYLLQWSSLATRTAFNIDFVNYAKQLVKAKADFTPSGWGEFMKAMNNSGLLDAVKSKKLEMSAVVSGAPVILSTAVIHGRFTWRVQLPILVTFTSASATSQSSWIVTMNVERISTLDAYKGIQINDF